MDKRRNKLTQKQRLSGLIKKNNEKHKANLTIVHHSLEQQYVCFNFL